MGNGLDRRELGNLQLIHHANIQKNKASSQEFEAIKTDYLKFSDLMKIAKDKSDEASVVKAEEILTSIGKRLGAFSLNFDQLCQLVSDESERIESINQKQR